MKILAIEFSTNRREIAVLDGPLWGTGVDASAPVTLLAARDTTQHTPALELMDAAIQAAGLEREAIEGLAVGLGPGSYTGIRAAISLAQGWQLACGATTVGVSSADCLAEQFAAGNQGQFWVVLDAQRSEFYLAGGRAEGGVWHWTEPLHLATREEVLAKTEDAGSRIGPEISRWFSGGQTLHPDAETVGRLAWRQGRIEPAERLEPIYMRAVSFVKAPPPIRIPGE